MLNPTVQNHLPTKPISANRFRKMFESDSFSLWLAKVLFLMGLIALLMWISLRPKHPNYTIIEFSIPALNGRNTTFPPDDSTVDFILEISNPNKDSSIFFDNINVTLYFGDDIAGRTTIPSFHQGKNRNGRFEESIDPDRRLGKVVFRAVLNGTTQFKVGVVTKIRYRTLFFKSKRHGVNMQGFVPVGSDGKIRGKKKKIKLHRSPKKIRFQRRH